MAKMSRLEQFFDNLEISDPDNVGNPGKDRTSQDKKWRR